MSLMAMDGFERRVGSKMILEWRLLNVLISGCSSKISRQKYSLMMAVFC